MPAPRKYPLLLRERAMRLVAKASEEDPELPSNAALVRIVQRVGVNPARRTFGGAHPMTPAECPKSPIRDSVIERLEVGGIDEESAVPYFQQELIGLLDGVAALPQWLEGAFAGCEIDRFSIATHTTAGVMQLGIDRDSRSALSVLKKVLAQRGSGRKEGALSRVLSLADRPAVTKVIDELVSQGWLQKSSSGNNVLYLGSKSRRKDALDALESPADFRL